MTECGIKNKSSPKAINLHPILRSGRTENNKCRHEQKMKVNCVLEFGGRRHVEAAAALKEMPPRHTMPFAVLCYWCLLRFIPVE